MNGHEGEPSDPDRITPKGFDDFELTLGDILRGERATLGKSLLDVQRDIKIKAEYIAAIEDTDLSVFETPGFIAGYVRSYARYLGMNADWVYQNFCDQSGFSHVDGLDARVFTTRDPAKPTTPLPRGRSTVDFGDAVLARSPIYAAPKTSWWSGIQPGAVGSLLVLAALFVGLGYGAWSVVQEIQRVTVAPVETPLPDVNGARGDTNLGLVAENSAPSVQALERLYRPRTLDTPVLTPRDGPIATLDPARNGLLSATMAPVLAGVAPRAATVPRAPEAGSGTAAPDVQVAAAKPPEVVLFARNPAWVRVRATDGTVLLEKIMEAGERYVLPDGEVAPTLRAGNSGSVFFAVNGETLGPAGPGTSVAKNVVMSADSLAETYETADLTADPDLARLAAVVIEPVADAVPIGTD